MPLHFADGGGGKRQKVGLLEPAEGGYLEGPCSLLSSQPRVAYSRGCILPRAYIKQAVCPHLPGPAAPHSAASGMGSLDLDLKLSLSLHEAPTPPTFEVALRVTLSCVSSVVRPLWMVALLLFSVHPVPDQGRLHSHPAHWTPYTLLTGRQLLHPCPRPFALVIDSTQGRVASLCSSFPSVTGESMTVRL